MYIILGIVTVHAEHLQEFLTHVREHARRSLDEPGCHQFDVLQDEKDPQTVCLYEVFGSQADFETHRSQDYYTRWMTLSRDWRDRSSYSRRVLRNVHPTDEAWPLKS